MGLVLAIVFGAANAYLGLKVGMTVSASIPAAVVSMGVLRLLFRRGSILECNMSQTIGSAGESVAAGAVFTLPTLFLWAAEGRCAAPDVGMITLVSVLGGTLGVLFMVPLRRALLERGRDQLPFPEGSACADVLRAGERQAKGAGAVLTGFGCGAVLVPALNAIHLSFSPALLGVGWIVGLRAGVLMVAGSVLSHLLLVPLAAWHFGCSDEVAWSEHVKFVGVGAIATAGLLSLAKSVPTLFASLSGRTAAPAAEASSERDLPRAVVWGGLAVLMLAVWLLPQIPVGFLGAVLIVVFGFFFTWVAARTCGLIGSSNSPVSGMTIATLLFAVPVMKMLPGGESAVFTGVMTVGAIVCLVCSIAGDTAQDLKTGLLVGASPWRQQAGEILGVVASSLAIGGTIHLMNAAWGFGGAALPAPQATLMKSIVECSYGGALPWSHLALGALIPLVAFAFRLPAMAVSLGTYLPFSSMVTVFVGSLVRTFALRAAVDGREATEKTGTLLSAGVIAGEGIAGIVVALVLVLC